FLIGDNAEAFPSEKPFISDYAFKANCFDCHGDEEILLKNTFAIPTIRLLPASTFYPIIQLREKDQLTRVSVEPGAFIDASLSFALRRLGEIKLLSQKQNKNNSDVLIANNLNEYQKLVGNAYKKIPDIQDEVRRNQYKLRFIEFIDSTNSFLQSLLQKDENETDIPEIISLQQIMF